MKKIDSKKVVQVNYIKLGQNGSYTKECIENGYIKLGYNEIVHDLCIDGQWGKVRENIILNYKCGSATATKHRNQIKKFYEGGDDVLWITFFANKMWWCFSSNKIIYNSDGTKTRKTSMGWSDKDIKNKHLSEDRIRGDIRAKKFFQGTICDISDKDYIINKINGQLPADVTKCEEDANNLKQSVEKLILKLQPNDFELLVDLIFRQAGWQRVDYAGGNLPDIDLALFSPITNENMAVQIKCRSGSAQFNDWRNIVSKMDQFDRFYYVVHTPLDNLKKYRADEEEKIDLLLSERLSELVVCYGLVDWLIRKVS